MDEKTVQKKERKQADVDETKHRTVDTQAQSDHGMSDASMKFELYHKKLISISILLVSIFLLIEHLWTYGRFDLLDFIGHEYLALFGILFVFLWNTKWSQWKELKLWHIRNQFR